MQCLASNIEPQVVWHRVQYRQTSPSCKLILVFAKICHSLYSHIEIQDLRSGPFKKMSNFECNEWLPLFFVWGPASTEVHKQAAVPSATSMLPAAKAGFQAKIQWSRRASQIRLSKIPHPLFLFFTYLIYARLYWYVVLSMVDVKMYRNVRRKDGKSTWHTVLEIAVAIIIKSSKYFQNTPTPHMTLVRLLDRGGNTIVHQVYTKLHMAIFDACSLLFGISMAHPTCPILSPIGGGTALAVAWQIAVQRGSADARVQRNAQTLGLQNDGCKMLEDDEKAGSTGKFEGFFWIGEIAWSMGEAGKTQVKSVVILRVTWHVPCSTLGSLGIRSRICWQHFLLQVGFGI